MYSHMWWVDCVLCTGGSPWKRMTFGGWQWRVRVAAAAAGQQGLNLGLQAGSLACASS